MDALWKSRTYLSTEGTRGLCSLVLQRACSCCSSIQVADSGCIRFMTDTKLNISGPRDLSSYLATDWSLKLERIL